MVATAQSKMMSPPDTSTIEKLASTIEKLGVPAVESIFELPPGLEPPPGLELPPGLLGEAQIQKPPGLEDPSPSGCEAILTQSTESVDEESTESVDELIRALPLVRIKGIPDQLLTRPLMDTVFEQARLEHAIVGYSMVRGAECGEVRVSLSTDDAVAWCVRHFSGCQWASGVVITCDVIPPAVTKAATKPPVLSPSAQVFVPVGSSSSVSLSVDAPSFVPASLKHKTKALGEPAKVHLPSHRAVSLPAHAQAETSSCDASTDTGESASECE